MMFPGESSRRMKPDSETPDLDLIEAVTGPMARARRILTECLGTAPRRRRKMLRALAIIDQAEAAAVDLYRRLFCAETQRFVFAFGSENGVKWFLEGLSFSQATARANELEQQNRTRVDGFRPTD